MFQSLYCRKCKRELTAVRFMKNPYGERICPVGHEAAKLTEKGWARKMLSPTDQEAAVNLLWEGNYITTGELNYALKELDQPLEGSEVPSPPAATFMEEFKETMKPYLQAFDDLVSTMPEVEQKKLQEDFKAVGKHAKDIVEAIPNLLASDEFKQEFKRRLPEEKKKLLKGGDK